MDSKNLTNQLLPFDIKPNIPNTKIFGKAQNISLKPIENEKNYKKVYKGLFFLESLKKGDILVVANGVTDYAFFGELMSNLARIKGVEGVVIDGCTRDYAKTIKMKFPIFSKNNFARDIYKRGIIDKIDITVKIGGVKIRSNDYIFGDIDGVIIIPHEIIHDVLNEAIIASDREKKILRKIKGGLSVKEIFNEYGEF